MSVGSRIGPASTNVIEMFAPTRIRRPCNSSLLEWDIEALEETICRIFEVAIGAIRSGVHKESYE